MLLALVIFAVGSTICGAAQSMDMLIAGRCKFGPGLPLSHQRVVSNLIVL